MDLVGDPASRDPVRPFVEFLLARGNAYERKVIARFAQTASIVDLSMYSGEDRERRTLEAMRAGAGLIYSGRLSAAYSAGCKLCHWYSTCLKALRTADDLTLVPRLGRTARDVMSGEFPTIAQA